MRKSVDHYKTTNLYLGKDSKSFPFPPGMLRFSLPRNRVSTPMTNFVSLHFVYFYSLKVYIDKRSLSPSFTQTCFNPVCSPSVFGLQIQIHTVLILRYLISACS